DLAHAFRRWAPPCPPADRAGADDDDSLIHPCLHECDRSGDLMRGTADAQFDTIILLARGWRCYARIARCQKREPGSVTKLPGPAAPRNPCESRKTSGRLPSGQKPSHP